MNFRKNEAKNPSGSPAPTHLLNQRLGLAPVPLQILLLGHEQRILAALQQLPPVEPPQVLQQLGGSVRVGVVIPAQEKINIDARILDPGDHLFVIQKLELLDLEFLLRGDIVLVQLVLEQVALLLAGGVLFLLGQQPLDFFGVDDVEDGLAAGGAEARAEPGDDEEQGEGLEQHLERRSNYETR